MDTYVHSEHFGDLGNLFITWSVKKRSINDKLFQDKSYFAPHKHNLNIGG